MRINHILSDSEESGTNLLLRKLKTECSQFVRESRGLPVFKLLPAIYENFQKVKIRKHKKSTAFNKTFNEAFSDEMRDIRNRSLFGNGRIPEPEPEKDLFYIFPKDGYKFMYCKEVQHSTDDYKQVFESIFQNVEDPQEIIHDLLKFSYIKENLNEGIESEAEIIFYNIPYYYSVRTTLYTNYNDLLTDVSELKDNA